MKKEAKRQHEVAQMDEADRKNAEQVHEESLKRHKQHEKINHPGGKEQLEEVLYLSHLKWRHHPRRRCGKKATA